MFSHKNFLKTSFLLTWTNKVIFQHRKQPILCELVWSTACKISLKYYCTSMKNFLLIFLNIVKKKFDFKIFLWGNEACFPHFLLQIWASCGFHLHMYKLKKSNNFEISRVLVNSLFYFLKKSRRSPIGIISHDKMSTLPPFFTESYVYLNYT